VNAIGDGAAAYRSPDERQRVVAVRFAGDRDCWLLTQDPANGPYAIPLSFVVSGQHALMATASASRTVKNVEIDPRAALVLGGYGDAIRAYGRCAVLPLERVGRELRSSYVMKTGWDPERSGSHFVGLLLDMEKVLCSRSPTEDGDNVVWARDQPTPW
jgi:pyridoxamine 5'-phosphate oxidase-like protein